MRNNFEIFIHSKNKENRRFTVCAKSQQIDFERCIVSFSISYCNEEDNFSKRIGRNICLGRIEAKKCRNQEVLITDKLYTQVKETLHKMATVASEMKTKSIEFHIINTIK